MRDAPPVWRDAASDCISATASVPPPPRLLPYCELSGQSTCTVFALPALGGELGGCRVPPPVHPSLGSQGEEEGEKKQVRKKEQNAITQVKQKHLGRSWSGVLKVHALDIIIFYL